MNELTPNLSYIRGDHRIYPNSLLFKAGKYADKGIEVTPEDLAAAVADFQPVNLNLEHASHGALAVLNGKVGSIDRMWVDPEDPSIARGEVAVPLWLDSELTARAPSMEIRHTDKRFCGGALTYTPRISEAALMSAYATFAGSRHSANDAKDIQDAHDLMVKQGAACKAEMSLTGGDCASPDPPRDSGREERRSMTFKEKLLAFVHGENETDETPTEKPAGFSVGGVFVTPADVQKMTAERDAYKSVAEAHFTALLDDAKAEANHLYGAVEGPKKFAEKFGTVTFSASPDIALITAWRDLWKSQADAKYPAGKRQTEEIDPATFAAEADPTSADVDKLLAMTPIGRQALNNGKGGK